MKSRSSCSVNGWVGKLIAPLAAWLVLGAGSAVAQEQPAPAYSARDFEQLSLDALLNPTITTATKNARTLEQTPSIVTVFSREDIDRLGARQLIDLLRYVPGFYEVGSPLERNVAIRGVHAAAPYHFVVLLDGLAMNDFLFGSSSPDSFSLEAAERVEIIRGPGSAIYGANALMGVINIITQKPGDELHMRETVTVGLLGEVRGDLSFNAPTGSHGGGFSAAASFWRQDGTGFAASPREDVLAPTLGQNISDGLQPGENLTGPMSGAKPSVNRYGPSFDIFMKYQHDEGSALRLGVTRSELQMQRTARQGLFLDGSGPQRPRYILERLVLDGEKHWGKIDGLGQITFRPSFLMVGHDMRSETVDPLFYTGTEREVTAVVSGWSGRDFRISPAFEYSLELPDRWIFRQSTVVAGVQGQYDVAAGYQTTQCFVDGEHRFNPSVFARDDNLNAADLVCQEGLMLREGLTVDAFGAIRQDSHAPIYGDGDEVRIGSFLQLSSTLPRDIGFVLGGRVDYNVTYAPQFSPRVALVAPIYRGLYAKVQLSSGFVYPAFLYRTGNALSDYQGNPDIQPQRIRTLEGLVGFKNDRMRAELSGYYNDVTDFITFDLPLNARTGQFKFSNQGSIRIAGAEGTALFRFWGGRLLADLQGTYARPQGGTSEQFLVDGELGGPSKYPQLMGRAVVSAMPLHRLRLTADASVSSRVKQTIAREVQFEQIPGTDGLPYSTQDGAEFDTRMLLLGASANFTVTDRWQARLSGNNLLNHRFYRPGSVLIPYLAEGRRLLLSISYQF
jgi:outer membrane receptor protein involved in Fe transport